ncbi:MAG TPA: hypothetical protein VHJ17_02465 [Thermomonospora sp.]|nr:hypothetical protein [Thermomonospora sp.]
MAAMQARVSAFVALVDGTAHPLQGAYPVVSDSDVVVTFEPGEASVDRVDQVIVRVRDGVYDGSGVQEGSVEYLKGQPSGAASPLPPSSLALWEVKVPAGVSAANGSINFATARTRRFTYTTGVGTALPVENATERDALPVFPGLCVVRRDTGDVERFWAGAWQAVDWRAETGWTPISRLISPWRSSPSVFYPPQVRRHGPLVELRGTIDRAPSTSAASAGTLSVPSSYLLVLPSWFAPAVTTRWAAADYSATRQFPLRVETDGWVGADNIGGIPSTADVQLDTIWAVG